MSSRKKSEVLTTMDNTCIFSADIALLGATGSMVKSTDRAITVTGQNGGLVTVTLPTNNRYEQILGWSIETKTYPAYAGGFRLQKVADSAANGTFQFIVLSGSALVGSGIGTPVNTVAAAVGLTGSLTAILRNTNRTT